MRRLMLPVVASLAVGGAPALMAQTPPAAKPPAATPAAAPPASPPAAPADPVIAKVGPDSIYASELAEAAKGLPEELRGMPATMLYPMLLDQLIDRRAIVLAARKQGLQDDPAVRKQIQRATDSVLQNTLLTRDIAPTLTEAAIEARYKATIADKPGEQEVHAAHILVPDEEKAREIIKQIDGGADFNALATENSTDPSAKANSGDLGFFKKGDMLPEFADAAFALEPGQVTQTPVKTRFGWHVIKTLEKRMAEPPPLDQVREEIRQSLIQEGVAKALASAKEGLAIEKFNQDGTPMTAEPAASPAPAPATPAK